MQIAELSLLLIAESLPLILLPILGLLSAATVTIGVPNFVDDITNTGTVSSASLNFILTDDFTHTSDSFSAFNNFSNLAITTNGVFTNNNNIDLAGDLTITANTFNQYCRSGCRCINSFCSW